MPRFDSTAIGRRAFVKEGSLFVTNAAAEALPWKAVVVLYQARWQIELLF